MEHPQRKPLSDHAHGTSYNLSRTYIRHRKSVLPQTQQSPTVGWMKACLITTNVLLQRIYKLPKILIFYYDGKINFRHWKNSNCYKGFLCGIVFLLFLILLIYRHSCIVYLQGMGPLGLFAWILVSLVVYLESLHGQSYITLTP